MFGLGKEAVLHRLAAVLEVLKDAWQAHLGRLGDSFDDEGGGVHEAVVLNAVEDRIRHGQVDNFLERIFAPRVLLVNSSVSF